VADDPPPMPQPMGEKTNLGGAKEGLGKMGEKEKERWWTIGRDSKDESFALTYVLLFVGVSFGC